MLPHQRAVVSIAASDTGGSELDSRPWFRSICLNFNIQPQLYVDCVWNVMTHAQKPDFVFRRNGRVHLNRRGRQFSRLLAAEVFGSAVVMLDTPCSEVVWRVLANYSIRQFPLHFPSRASPCARTFQLDSTSYCHLKFVWVSVVYCQVEVSAMSWSLAQRISTDCDASLCVI